MSDEIRATPELTQDVIRYILEYLDGPQARSCRLLSKSWHDLATIYGFGSLDISVGQDHKRLTEKVQTLKHVRRRKFRGVFLKQLEPCLYYVRRLAIHISGSPKPVSPALVASTGPIPHPALTLSGQEHEKAVVRGLRKILSTVVAFQRLGRLEILDVRADSGHRISSQHVIAEALLRSGSLSRDADHIRSLVLYSYRTQAPCFDYDIQLLRSLKSLDLDMHISGEERHNFRQSGRPDRFFRRMPKMILGHCPGLTSLELTCNRYWGWYPSSPGRKSPPTPTQPHTDTHTHTHAYASIPPFGTQLSRRHLEHQLT
jgi:hypothetical protein